MDALNANVALLLLIFAPAAVVPWLYGHKHRLIAWLFAVVAFLAVAGIPAWRKALVSLIATPHGLGVLMGLDVAFGIAFWVEAIHRGRKPAQSAALVPQAEGPKSRRPKAKRAPNKHNHRIRTPVVAMVFATCAALTLGAGTEMLAELGKSPAATGRAISQSARQISRISAGHAAPMRPQHAGEIIATGVGIVIVLVIAASMAEKRKKDSRPSQRAIGGAPSGFTPAKRGG